MASDLRDYRPESFRIPQRGMEEKLLGFRTIPLLTFSEAYSNCITVRILFAASALFGGLALGFGIALFG